MSSLHLFLGDRIGWVLVHSIWQFLLIALFAFALIRILRHGPATVRYGLLLVALAMMTLMPIATWMAMPQPPVAATMSADADRAGVEHLDGREEIAEAAVSAGAEAPAFPSAVARRGRAADAAESPPAAPDETVIEPTAGTATPWWHGFESRLRPWLPSLVAFWCVGVLAFSLRPLLSWYAVQRLRRVGVSAVPELVRNLLADAAARLGVRQAVQVLQSARVGTPVVVGAFRPLILLPGSVVTGLPPAQLEAILVHELAHIRRHDYFVNLLQTLVETLFFYHPAVWWLSHQIRCERENCCDDAVVAALGSRVDYGRALLALEEQRGVSTALAMAAGRGSLLARVRRLQAGWQPIASWQIAATAAVAVLPTLLIALGLWSMLHADERASEAPAAYTVAMPDDEQRAWDELEAAGATIHGPAFHRQHLRRHLASLERINFPEPHRKQIREQIAEPIRSANLWQIPAEAWPLVARLKSLQELDVNSSDMGGEAFRHIAALPNLRRLTVSGSKCLPTDAAHLKRATTLERIEIAFTFFEDPAEPWRELADELTEAEQAWVESYRTRSNGREHLIEAAILTDRMLEELRDLPRLKSLRLVNTLISPRGAEAIAVHANLEELDVNLVDLTPEAARAIGRLTHLRRFRYANASDETLEALAELTKLEELDLWAGAATDAGVRHLLPLRSLRKLALRGSSLSDRGLLELATLPNLERLDLPFAKGSLTAQGLAEFQRLRPECQLVAEAGAEANVPEANVPANRILDAQGRGIAGATLQILPYERPRSGKILATFTADGSGRFEYPPETPDDRPFYLVVSAPGFVTDEWIGNSHVHIKRAGVPVPDVLRLADRKDEQRDRPADGAAAEDGANERLATGRVVDAETGEPIDSFRVLPGTAYSGTEDVSRGDAVGQPASDSSDAVTERLFRQYVVARGKLETTTVNAAIELVAARAKTPEFIDVVLAEFEKSCEEENARTTRRNLLALLSKMLAREGAQRWRYELARRSGEVEPSATTVTPRPSPESDEIVYRESEMLARVIARGRKADRHDIVAFVIAVRQAHHPQGKPFLLDVLRNPPDPLSADVAREHAEGKWPDNGGGTWLDAKFHAAVGLAELGKPAGVDWLIEQSERNEFGTGSMSASLNHAPHRKASRSSVRESCLHVLADLSGLPAETESAQWKAWWAASQDDFVPSPVALQID